MKYGNKKWKYPAWVVALKIVFQEMKHKRSFNPLKRMWKKTMYGERWPYKIIATLPDYVKFCRINGIRLHIPKDEELA